MSLGPQSLPLIVALHDPVAHISLPSALMWGECSSGVAMLLLNCTFWNLSAQTAVLWAPMQLPEITIANQSLLKTGFRNASQVDVFSAVSSIARVELFRLVPWVLFEA